MYFPNSNAYIGIDEEYYDGDNHSGNIYANNVFFTGTDDTDGTILIRTRGNVPCSATLTNCTFDVII